MLLPTDTIVALASPPGRGLEGIIRLSGPDAMEIGGRLFRSPEKLEDAPTFSALRGKVVTEALPPVPALAYVMRSPATYTREDMVEFHLPASTPILRCVMRAVIAEGARAAEPGEFTERAFLSGRIDLAQAEAVLRAVHAVHLTELRNAVMQLRGFAHREIQTLRDDIVELMSLLELNIDFSDQDITLAGPEEVTGRIARIRKGVDEILRRASRLIPAEGVPVALYGPVNAGKSTLFNALIGTERAIVSRAAGTTRDYLHAEIEVDGMTLRLIDTAGIRETGDVVERVAQKRSREQASAAGVLVYVLDIRDARAAISPPERAPDIVALNKADLAEGKAERVEGEWPCPVVRVSALKGRGLAELRRALLRAVELQVSGGHAFVPNLRQTACLEKASEALDAALEASGEEIIAYELRHAANHLAEVIGEVPSEELLNRIFSGFCIGK